MADLYREISQSIVEKLAGVSSEGKILSRITNMLIIADEAFYVPKMVSIGPYHRGKDNLQTMEKYKLQYLREFLNRHSQEDVSNFINYLLLLEPSVRRSYTENLAMDSKGFVEMMLLDGCFIIQFLRKRAEIEGDNMDNTNDLILKTGWISDTIRRDLLLYENQIPYVILVKLFKTMNSSNNQFNAENRFRDIAVKCLKGAIKCNFSDRSRLPNEYRRLPSFQWDPIHLLSLMYYEWCFPIAQSRDYTSSTPDVLINVGGTRIEATEDEPAEVVAAEVADDILFIKSVTELEQDGIKFVEAVGSTSWLEIGFNGGEMKIPHLVIDDSTEYILRNLIVYELYSVGMSFSGRYVIDYVRFMACLIHTPMDARKLHVKGIIKNCLGNDEQVTNMFNNVCENVYPIRLYNTYRQQFKDVREHCNKRWNMWIVELMMTYFKDPWSIISLLVATAFLILAFIQTVRS